MGWCTSAQARFLEISRISARGGVAGLPGGNLVFTREAQIAEMKVSEPSKNTFLFSSKTYFVEKS